MFDLIDNLTLMCCWCCDRKSKDEEEYEISEREQAQKQREKDLKEGTTAATVQEQPKKVVPRLAHAPQLEQPLPLESSNGRYYAGTNV
jgi:hypothetical protein